MKKILFAVTMLAAILAHGMPPKLPFTIDPQIPGRLAWGKELF